MVAIKIEEKKAGQEVIEFEGKSVAWIQTEPKVVREKKSGEEWYETVSDRARKRRGREEKQLEAERRV
eukprot:765309-Hanusia_phi.AAC.2